MTVFLPTLRPSLERNWRRIEMSQERRNSVSLSIGAPVGCGEVLKERILRFRQTCYLTKCNIRNHDCCAGINSEYYLRLSPLHQTNFIDKFDKAR